VKYYKQVIRPMLEYGIQIYKPTKTQEGQLEAIQHMYLTKIAGVYITTRKTAMRILLGIIPLKARMDLLRLKTWYQTQNAENVYRKYVTKEIQNVKEKYENMTHCRQKSYTIDVYETLREYELEEYWEERIEMTQEKWNTLIRKKVLKKAYLKDIQEITQSESCMFLRALAADRDQRENYYDKIQEIDIREDTKNFAPFARVITGNPNFNWKKTIDKKVERQTTICPWCLTEWQQPIRHVILDCKNMEMIRKQTWKQTNNHETEITPKQFFQFCKKAFSNSQYI
ncbi:hypothetical protein RFI_35164, partial [Reticulomyxa filosa]